MEKTKIIVDKVEIDHNLVKKFEIWDTLPDQMNSEDNNHFFRELNSKLNKFSEIGGNHYELKVNDDILQDGFESTYMENNNEIVFEGLVVAKFNSRYNFQYAAFIPDKKVRYNPAIDEEISIDFTFKDVFGGKGFTSLEISNHITRIPESNFIEYFGETIYDQKDISLKNHKISFSGLINYLEIASELHLKTRGEINQLQQYFDSINPEKNDHNFPPESQTRTIYLEGLLNGNLNFLERDSKLKLPYVITDKVDEITIENGYHLMPKSRDEHRRMINMKIFTDKVK